MKKVFLVGVVCFGAGYIDGKLIRENQEEDFDEFFDDEQEEDDPFDNVYFMHDKEHDQKLKKDYE